MSECYSCGFDAEEHLRKTHEAANVLADRDRLAARVRVLEEALRGLVRWRRRDGACWCIHLTDFAGREREQHDPQCEAVRAALGVVAAPMTEEKPS